MSTKNKNNDSSRTKHHSKTQTRQLEKTQSLADLADKFNTVVMGIVKHLSEYYNEVAGIGGMDLILSSIIHDAPEEPIAYFIMNVYKNDDYRTNILNQNDKFFVNHHYDEHLKDGDKDRIAKLFEFKELWKQIDTDTKNYIKKAMLALVKISQKYILTL